MCKMMIFLLIIFFPMLQLASHAEERSADGKHWVEDSIPSMGARIQGQLEEYKGQKRSLINWDDINPKKWSSLKEWAKDRAIKDESPDWIINRKALAHNELMGRMIDCVGECRIYRGRGHAKGQYLSSIKEGDEISTLKNSYAWIFMMDGTLVRLSPFSSISVKEINIGKEKIFLYVRINSGNVLWLSRATAKIKIKNARETDTIFLPLSFHRANYFEVRNGGKSEKSLFDYINRVKNFKYQYVRANKLLAENNKIIGEKKTQSFLVMSNGTVYGESLQIELIVLLGDKSYFKNRSRKSYLEVEEEGPGAKFTFRGYNETKEFNIMPKTWYEVSKNGREIMETTASDEIKKSFSLGEYITKRIPSLFVARELFLQKYSLPLFAKNLTKKALAKEWGYRLWGQVRLYKNKAGSLQYSRPSGLRDAPSFLSDEFEKRLEFLKEYTRRSETTGIFIREKFRKKYLKNREFSGKLTYGDHFYKMAFDHYVGKSVSRFRGAKGKEILNSTERPLWYRINSRRRKRSAY